MKIIRSHISACVLAAGFAAGAAHAQPLPLTTATTAGFSTEGLERLDRFFAREIEAKRVPGDLRKYYREQVQVIVYGAMTR